MGDGFSQQGQSGADMEILSSEESLGTNFAPINFSQEGIGMASSVQNPTPVVHSEASKSPSNISDQVPKKKIEITKQVKVQKEVIEKAKLKVNAADFDLDQFLDALHG